MQPLHPRGHCGKPIKSHKLAAALSLLRKRQANPADPNLSYRKIAKSAGLLSVASVHSIAHTNMEPEAIAVRKLRKGWRRLLSLDEQRVVCGWLLSRREKGKPVGGAQVRSFVARAFGIAVSASWVSRFAENFHLQSHKVHGRTYGRARASARTEMIEFLLRVRALSIPPQKLVCVDCTGIYSHNTVLRSYGPIGE